MKRVQTESRSERFGKGLIVTQSTLGRLHRLQIVENGVQLTLKVVHLNETILLLVLALTRLVVLVAIRVTSVTLPLRLQLLSATVDTAVTRADGGVVVKDGVTVRVGVLIFVSATWGKEVYNRYKR